MAADPKVHAVLTTMLTSRRLYRLSHGVLLNMLDAAQSPPEVEAIMTGSIKTRSEENFDLDTVLIDLCRDVLPWTADHLAAVKRALRTSKNKKK